jgi:hypothetical protein
MFEHRKEPMLPMAVFLRRMAACLGIAGAMVAFGLGIGVLGYRFIAAFSWIDALLNSCMILGGMGPVGELPNNAAKLFASFFALFSGLIFISVMAVLISPVAHRMLHHFHVAEEDLDESPQRKPGRTRE